jgi:DNA mismatch repair protein MutS
MCVWLERISSGSRLRQFVDKLAVGVGMIDIYTGRTGIYSYLAEGRHGPAAFDELERTICINNPSEILLVSDFDEKITSEVIQFSGMTKELVRVIDMRLSPDSSSLVKKAKNAEKQAYQLDTLKRMFPTVADHDALLYEYQNDLHAVQAFTLLVNYVHSHNPNLASKIKLPENVISPNRLQLANHSLKQLNIISGSDSQAGNRSKLACVSNLLNSCVTASGKRAFQSSLLNPSADEQVLQRHYDITDVCLTSGVWREIRQRLKDVKDIEKLARKLVLNRFTPKDLATLFGSIRSIHGLMTHIESSDDYRSIVEYMEHNGVLFTADSCNQILSFINERVNVDDAEKVDSTQFGSYTTECQTTGTCFLRTGYNRQLDQACIGGIKWKEQIEAVRSCLNGLVTRTETKAKGDVVKLHETPTMPPTLILTKRRGSILALELAKVTKNNPLITLDTVSCGSFEFDLSQVRLENASSKSDNVVLSPQLRDMFDGTRTSKDNLTAVLTEVYKGFCGELACFNDTIMSLADLVQQMDLIQCRCYVAAEYSYCKPTIIGSSEHSFVSATELRHPLIERIQGQELYVTNDVSLGNGGSNGMLLFGTNAVGKTSLIKSLGIAVVMAQAGLYVPCSQFEFSPYKSLFTRILGNDNLHRGLSTFAVEMIELRTILKMADKNSLILGDELCSGTESDSALSIFAAGVEHLHSVNCSFVFATHFHEIVEFDEVKQLGRLTTKHLTVEYNQALDTLVYDRKLKDGPGDRMYGLEVCKSLDLPQVFLERAHDLRNKYNKQSRDCLEATQSHFNVKQLVGRCELCHATATEVHHLQHQKHADASNRIKHFHKNHVANLVTLCSKCHDLFHETETQYMRKKTTKGYVLTPIDS